MADTPVLLPTLSEDGWVESTSKVADMLMSHFFISNFSQSYIHAGRVSSFPYILAVNHGNIEMICSETRSVLSAYFGRYFDNVGVEVKEVDNPDEPSKAALSMLIQFTDKEGKNFSVGQILEVIDSKFRKIADINNGEGA